MANARQPYHADDIAFWPDGTSATLGEVWDGAFNHMSDDFEIVRQDDHARLKVLGLAEDFDIT